MNGDPPHRLVAIDLGGTNIRFAAADVGGGQVTALGDPLTLKSGDYDGLPGAWADAERRWGLAMPRSAALSVAGPVIDDTVQLTNLPWRIRRGELAEGLGLDAVVLVNDFEAVGHAVAQLGPEHFVHLCGPEEALPDEGVISIVGPGTGLGVAMLSRRANGYRVLPTEGGHIGFAPVDDFEDRLLAGLRARLGRVSAERVVAGPGISDIYAALGGADSMLSDPDEDRSIWSRAASGADPLAAQAVERFCKALGSVAGDLALAHGARGLVIAGGVGRRLAGVLPTSGFAARFVAKGRFSDENQRLPVKIVTHPEPGLYGAAAAFARAIA